MDVLLFFILVLIIIVAGFVAVAAIVTKAIFSIFSGIFKRH